MRTANQLPMVIENALGFVHHKVRHLAIDVARELDEASLNVGLLALPRQINGSMEMQWPPSPGPGEKGHEAKWHVAVASHMLMLIRSHIMAISFARRC